MNAEDRCRRLGCTRPAVKDFGRVRICAQCKPVGHLFSVAGICADCGGDLFHPIDGHNHTVTRSAGYAEPVCCTCRHGQLCEASTPARTSDKSLLKYLRNIRDTKPDPSLALPESSSTSGHFVISEKTGRTAHSSTKDGMAVCGTRNIAKGQRSYYDALPPGFGHCWKCAKGG